MTHMARERTCDECRGWLDTRPFATAASCRPQELAPHGQARAIA